jgi:2,3-bisphosphoglycerate-independent phosphoglycerate mutase
MMVKKTKYVVVIGDGMADYPLKELKGQTPLEAARTPNMDRLAAFNIGLAGTIPEGMEAGSDVANLALLGYDPVLYHTGRSPFEAASMGVKLAPSEVAFRMNLVTLEKGHNNSVIMKSHSAGDITTGEASLIIGELKRNMKFPTGIRIYPGVAYRHLLVWKNGPETLPTIPPHDVLDQEMTSYLGSGGADDPVVELIRASWEHLERHPVNIQRKNKGLREANSIWLWGQGRSPDLPPFQAKFGIKGGIISAVDLLKGIGIYAGLDPIYVEGATGYLDTNYTGKAEAALEALDYIDFVFVHVEAPDEAGHNGNIEEKIQAIEAVDEKVVGTLLKELPTRFEDYRIMVASDHFTPVYKRTHTREPVPFAWADKQGLETGAGRVVFTEEVARRSGVLFEKGQDLMPVFLGDL